MPSNNLNRQQFTVFEDTFDVDESDYTRSMYTLARPTGDDDGSVNVHGEVEVVHERDDRPVSYHPWNRRAVPGDPLLDMLGGREETATPGTQDTLFDSSPNRTSRPRSYVSLMSVSEDTASRAMVPALLAIAERHTNERQGRTLSPDTDRTAHSERLVQKLAGAGVIEGNERTRTNNVGFYPSHLATAAYLGNQLGDDEVARGRRDGRAIVRSMRPPRPQGEQLKLWEDEA